MIQHRKFAAALLLLFALAVPLITCALPGIQMTQAESECCQHMAATCGSASMQDSHTCCKQFSPGNDNFLQTANWHPVFLQAAVQMEAAILSPAFGTIRTGSATIPPPESPPASNAILRI